MTKYFCTYLEQQKKTIVMTRNLIQSGLYWLVLLWCWSSWWISKNGYLCLMKPVRVVWLPTYQNLKHIMNIIGLLVLQGHFSKCAIVRLSYTQANPHTHWEGQFGNSMYTHIDIGRTAEAQTQDLLGVMQQCYPTEPLCHPSGYPVIQHIL